MQMPCCGEEESEQQMSGTASRRKRSVAYSRCAEEGRGIEYKVGFCGNEEWAPPRRGSFVFLLAPFFLSSFLPSCWGSWFRSRFFLYSFPPARQVAQIAPRRLYFFLWNLPIATRKVSLSLSFFVLEFRLTLRAEISLGFLYLSRNSD